jgi:excisionase family DNA binding protein
MGTTLNHLITTREAAALLGLTRGGAQRLIERGILVPQGKIGGSYVFDRTAVRRARKRPGPGRPKKNGDV